ncbi:MAG: Rab family GTPase [Promethearchaeota archaeon]
MDYRAKVSLIGNENTGKTSLIIRYINNTFSEEYMTTLGADFVDKVFTSSDLATLNSDDTLSLTVWDMAGQSHFKDIAKIYCEGSAGFIIVFDVNNADSFDAVKEWKEFQSKICPDACFLVVGNKSDLEHKISSEKIAKLEKEIKAKIIFTSAKEDLMSENSNVKNVFESMARDIFQKHKANVD